MAFEVDSRLLADGSLIGETELCVALLMNDRRFPWLVLVPKVEGAREVYDLDEKQRALLAEESAGVARGLMTLFKGHKMNVAALGNVVPQLHVHHVVRFETDAAWPKPIWGIGEREPYDPADLDRIRTQIHAALPFIRA